jgi:hypothetical protein
MATGDWKMLARVLALTAVAVAFWAMAKYSYKQPNILPANAPPASFSAERAYATLGRLLGPEKPHPVSSDENAAVRARIQKEFAAIGVTSTTYTAFACNAWRGFASIPCATVTNIVAEIVPGEGRAIVLLAHYDSVPAGPGASDDESGVATVLETARALRSRAGKSLHPVLAVITDGEEAGLLGAQALLQSPAFRARVGVVVNVEARGTRGRSLLFQTSPGDGNLIDLYARSVPYFATSSLYAEIYRLLPNDTDLTLFIKQGYPSFNFAFSDNVADYHTPLDRRDNLSKRTLQQQGDNMLGVSAKLERTNYADLAGRNAVYLDIFGALLPRFPAAWALPLAAVCLLIMVAAAFRTEGNPRRDWALAILLPPALLIVCGLVGLLLHTLAEAISGQPDPSYAYPIALREGLAFGVLASVLLVARMASAHAATLSVWLWFALLSVATAAFLPGLSPYFLFPALLASAAGLVLIAAPHAMRGTWGDAVFGPAEIVALAIWLGLVAAGEGLMGLKLHLLFTIPAAFAAMALLPYLDAQNIRRGLWIGLIAASAGGALIATVIAGLQPAFSRTQAQRLSIRYVEDATSQKASWALDTGAPIPPPLRAAANFSSEPVQLLPKPFPTYYVASASADGMHFPPPGADIVSDVVEGGAHRVTLRLRGSPQAATMGIIVPKAAKLRSIDIHGQHLAAPKGNNADTLLGCVSRDCAGETVGLEFGSRTQLPLTIIEQRYGLPSFAAKLIAARPANAVPSQTGDYTLLANTLTVKAQ